MNQMFWRDNVHGAIKQKKWCSWRDSITNHAFWHGVTR
jgi:hypothetical protein